LFPGKNTWYLFGAQVLIIMVTWILWMVLNIDQPNIDPGISGGQRTMEGLYQAVGLRACGYYIIEMRYIAPALQFLFMVVMYISAFPVMMSLRSTNIYEERSLGQNDKSKYGIDDDSGSKQNESQLGVCTSTPRMVSKVSQSAGTYPSTISLRHLVALRSRIPDLRSRALSTTDRRSRVRHLQRAVRDCLGIRQHRPISRCALQLIFILRCMACAIETDPPCRHVTGSASGFTLCC